MTQTLDPITAPSPAAERVDTWLSAFQDALTARDVDRAASMFLTQSFWRDLVAFSWNLTTVEGPDGVADLLRSTLDSTDPTGFATVEEPTEADGVTQAWIEFETAVGRGRGHLRLQDGPVGVQAWTLLTTLEELKGFEEPSSARVRRLRFASWVLDTARHELKAPDGAVVEISGAEYAVLLAFLEHPQRVMTRDRILELSRNRIGEVFDRSVDVLVSRLRRKLGDDPNLPRVVKSVRGAGYLFVPDVVSA